MTFEQAIERAGAFYTLAEIREMLAHTQDGARARLRRHFELRLRCWTHRDEVWMALEHLRRVRSWLQKLDAMENAA